MKPMLPTRPARLSPPASPPLSPRRNPRGLAGLFLVALGAVPACRAPGASAELLQAVAWTQSAAEHHALCWQVYQAATAALRRRLAALPPDSGRRAAVIVDIDETVLDNAPFQARLVLDGATFSEQRWNDWVEEAAAAPLPGALEFARACHESNVRVFYITNRRQEQEAATRRNLGAAGFPLDDSPDVDVVLTRGEVGGSSDKSARRNVVASRSVVLVTAGDDLNDFVAAARDLAGRAAQVAQHQELWGTEWFVLPNPMYGSWEQALLGDGSTDPVQARRGGLDPRRAP